jgi:N-acetylneuraminic acid mutarotase
MIIWGGWKGGGLSSGAIYTPATDIWTATPTTGAPSGRDLFAAVWTGTEMMVWGGWDGQNYLNTGARFNPATGVWTTLPASGAPVGRQSHTAVWTGNEMIIWGGFNGTAAANTGGRYNLSANAWIPTPTAFAPNGRYNHSAVWTGSEMIVWGGQSSSSTSSAVTFLNDGGSFNLAANTWTSLAASGAPAPRAAFSAAWAGTEMVIWGGGNDTIVFNDTYLYTLPTVVYLYQKQ